jgi:hypothetical protein
VELIFYFALSKHPVMKKILFLFVAAHILVSTCSIQSCKSTRNSASKLLKFNLEKGKGYDYEMVWDIDQQVMNQDIKMSVTAGYSVDIIAENENSKTISAVYNDFKMNMKMMGMEINVDTDKPSPDVTIEEVKSNPAAISALMNKLFSGIKGKKFNMIVNKEGEVTDVSGLEDIATAMADSLKMPEEYKEKITAMAKQRFNGEDIKKQFSQMFYIFPNKEVKVGDSWEKNYQIGGGEMPAKYNTTYKVKEIEGDIVTLDAKTDIESEMEAIKLKGEQTGTLLVDSKTGLVLNADFNQEIKTSINGQSMILKGKGKIKGKAK